LQPERTALAWQRTTLGLLANGGLFALRSAGDVARSALGVALVLALLVLSFVAAALGWRRERALGRRRVPRHVRPLLEVQLLGWSVVAVCATAAVVLALPRG
ncbi:MAG: hypothetical protein QOC80_3051, partial [Frankiaceae bacterium]|nr:hypothetical protein [Frankiaceae bacterium]